MPQKAVVKNKIEIERITMLRLNNAVCIPDITINARIKINETIFA